MPYQWMDGISLYYEKNMEEEEEDRKFRVAWNQAYRKNTERPKKIKEKKKVNLRVDVVCGCGGGWKYKTNKLRHLESNKHKKYIEDLEFQKNLKPELNEDET